MGRYEEALKGLNDAQKQAVTTIDGPVLVIAGPGTGKTQLLTTRIAHILATTDTLPQNILCLTFTESAAATMRERLANFIGQAAYDVTISTYHAFGSDLIRRFPDYFADTGEQHPVDDLGIDTIFRSILDGLPYSNPLKFAGTYLNDVKAFVSDAKRALLTPDNLRAVASDNQAFIIAANPIVGRTLASVSRMSKSTVPLFEELNDQLQALTDTVEVLPGGVVPLSALLLSEFEQALAEVADSGKTNALTKWKNAWLARDSEGKFIVEGQQTNARLKAAADVYAAYLEALQTQGLFDYDDMILRAVHTLETNDDLRFTLQEQYLYILLDEFQDTNGAQLKLVELLTNNPASEGRPNILAVGDDDQAIYAFQGANYSHMLQFQKLYHNVLVVPLTKNYRSQADILHVAQGVAGQIEERLHHHFPGIQKNLTAENTQLPAAVIERREAKSDIAQFAWVATQIEQLIKGGTPASEIAVLAPQHKHLEPLVPFLHRHNIPVRYEKRENILDDPAINQLLRMSELVEALRLGQHERASSLWAEVLSFDFWNIPTSRIWQLSWQASDDRENWTDTLLEYDDITPIVLFFIRLSLISASEPLETILDYLSGVTPLDLHEEPDQPDYRSPFYDHYFGSLGLAAADGDTKTGQLSLETALAGSDSDAHGNRRAAFGTFWQLLTHLTVLRSRLREYKAEDGEPLYLADFISFVAAHRAANIKVLNTSPYQEAADAVQLMTAYKAKGMEFSAVFVLGVNDEIWGSASRSQSARLSLPQNLQFIRYAGATNDERLRLFYVAITRAKTQLYLVNYTANYAGRSMNRLKYLAETTNAEGVHSPLLPPSAQAVLPVEDTAQLPASELTAYWQQRHEAALSSQDLRVLLQERLARFQLSPTHVGSFIDLINAGPTQFFMDVILHFPRAPLPQSQFGNAMHETLEWIHIYNRRHGHIPDLQATLGTFDTRLKAKRLSPQHTEQLAERGHNALTAYLAQRGHTIGADNECEYSFRNESVFVGPAHMAGKIDKLIIDKQARTITIVDYKTGRNFARWQNDPKLHKYQMQLYLYKMLVEGSRRFAGYTVTGGYLEFVEPDEDGTIQELHIEFDQERSEHLKHLVAAVWNCITTVNLPETTSYDPTYAGVLAFEQSLVQSLSEAPQTPPTTIRT